LRRKAQRYEFAFIFEIGVSYEKVHFHRFGCFIACRRIFFLYGTPHLQACWASRCETCFQAADDDFGFFEAGMWM
jgi:hypothetical protein